MKIISSRFSLRSGLFVIGAFVGALPVYAGGYHNASTEAEFKKMDSNSDGKVSAQEHAAGAKKMFEMMDVNKDGIVTAAEMDAAHDTVAGKSDAKSHMSSAEKIKAIDTDGDGSLSAAEHAAGSEKMFEKMDTDHDGFLSMAELAAGHAKMMPKSHE